MKITKQRLKEIIKEELRKEIVSPSDSMGRPDAAEWKYARTMLDSEIKSVLQDKAEKLNIDDNKIARVMKGLNNVIGPNPHITEELTKVDKEKKKELEKELGDLKHK